MGILFLEMILGDRISNIEGVRFPQKREDFPN